MAQLATYGDLKNLIRTISLKQKGQKLISKGKEFALDQVLGLLPGASNVKTGLDFIKTVTSLPDTKKTGTWLDQLDLDDQMLAIIDDTVENGFLQAMAKSIEAQPDNKELEVNFDMNREMVDYLKREYKNRTVVGVTELNMKNRFQELAGIQTETVATTPAQGVKVATPIKAVAADLKDQSVNFNNINTRDKTIQLLDTIVDKLDPNFKQTPGFKQAVIEFYKKYK
jgi:hypothetical protein